MRYTKQSIEVEPGRATWKFRLGERLIYRLKNADAMKLYWEMRDRKPFTVYVRTKQGWKFVCNRTVSDMCGCGRAYDDTPNGETFKFQEHPLVYTIEALTQVMCSPTLCMICYYKGELQEGRWAPKSVRKELGLET